MVMYIYPLHLVCTSARSYCGGCDAPTDAYSVSHGPPAPHKQVVPRFATYRCDHSRLLHIYTYIYIYTYAVIYIHTYIHTECCMPSSHR